jgi:hypothetical protein
LKKSISEKRAEYYIELWKLCDMDIGTQKKQKERFDKLRLWYSKGGGLLLPFKATDRFVGALNLLENSKDKKLVEEELEELKENLSWLRTEMKYEVGAYSRREAEKKLPNIKIREEKEEEEKEEEEKLKELTKNEEK